MAELVTIARPYAEAVFRLAKEANAFAEWSRMLALLDTVTRDPQLEALISDPNVKADAITRVVLDVCGSGLNDAGKNFVKILVENDRLGVVAQIAGLYEQLRREHENELEATIVSAFPLSDAQVQELVAGLAKRFGRQVKATATVDPSLIGGARILVGDVVIDGSAAGQLQKMASALKS